MVANDEEWLQLIVPLIISTVHFLFHACGLRYVYIWMLIPVPYICLPLIALAGTKYLGGSLLLWLCMMI